jgi:hypothetical protein
MASADLAPIRAAGIAEEMFVPVEEREAGSAERRLLPHAVHLLPFRDNYLGLRRSLAPLVTPAAARRKVLDWSHRPTPLGGVASLHHHSIVSNGRLAGIWEYDPIARRSAWAVFEPMDEDRRRSVLSAVGSVERFVDRDLGDLKFYALDGEAHRKLRLEGVRALQGA